MGAIDTLSKEIKQYTSIYGDILTGLHNDVNQYKNDVLAQKRTTNTALKKIDSLLVEARETTTNNTATLNRITNWDEKIKKDRVTISRQFKLLRNSITEHDEFIDVQTKKITKEQKGVEKIIKKNETFFTEKLELLLKLEEKITNEHSELINLNEQLNKRLLIQENVSIQEKSKLDNNLIVIYIVCFLLFGAVTYLIYNKIWF